MAAPHIGVTLPAGAAVPAGCYIENCSAQEDGDVSEVKDALTNTTAKIVPHKTINRKVTMSGAGTPALAAFATAGAFTAGTLKGVEIGFTESVDDVPKWDATYETHVARA